MGSGLTGTIAARDALGHRAEVIGVVAEQAPAYALSFARGEVVATDTADTMADGLACRVPDAEALEIIREGAGDIVQVSDAEIRAAMRAYFTDTHNVAEGAGAAALAAVLNDRARCRGKRVAVVLCGQNVDAAVFREVLAEA
jgi:threonine dehydratase